MARLTHSATDLPRRVLAAWLAASLVVGSAAGVARADDLSAMMDNAREVAKAHFKLGRSYQDARDYDRAIIEYQAAYAISPMPELLFNIGQCYRLRGEARSAVLYYQRYLQLVPGGGASDEARVHVAALRRTISAQPADAKLVMATMTTPEPVREDGRPGWRWIGAGGAFAGLAMTGVGFWYGIQAHEAAAQLEDAHGPFTHELEQVQRDGHTAQTRMLLFTGAGVTLMAAGGLTWWLSRSSGESRRVTAAPLLGPGQAGLAIAGTF